MKLAGMTISNYRQFEKAELNFDDGITILAGANNSGKTSLVTLIKNVFVEDKNEYSESDIPAKNMQEWIDKIYPSFQTFFENSTSIEKVEEGLVEPFIHKDLDLPQVIINTTEILRQYFINHPQSIDKYTFLQNSAFTHWVKEKCSKMC